MFTKKVDPPRRDHNAKRHHAALFIRNVPVKIKDAYKAWCKRRQLNMTELLIEIIKTVAEEGTDFITPKIIDGARKRSDKEYLRRQPKHKRRAVRKLIDAQAAEEERLVNGKKEEGTT